jgi:putative hydrolase of HD superfamily
VLGHSIVILFLQRSLRIVRARPVWRFSQRFQSTMSQWNPESVIPEDLKRYISSLSSGSSEDNATGNMLVFLHILSQLKATRRTGWINYGVRDPESISDHMYRMGVICMLTNRQSELNVGKCVKMALVHDMAESLVGDITPISPISKEEKHRRELATMEYLTNLILPFNQTAAEEMSELWNDYENVGSVEARFVKDVDKFELMVQTLEYERQHDSAKDLGQFMRVRSEIKTPEVAAWADQVLAERDKFWEGKTKPETPCVASEGAKSVTPVTETNGVEVTTRV